MRDQTILVTGAAGFLGSALCVDLSRDNTVVAIDRRKPGDELLAAAPSVEWYPLDVGDAEGVRKAFEQVRRHRGRIDFVVHLAAFYHFDLDWHPEYERTNVTGTANVIRACVEQKAGRLIFTSSIAALSPPEPGTLLDEHSPTSDLLPYGRSKAIGESMIADAAPRLSSTVLRLGGVFSDWCELPPLASLLELWGGPWPLDRILVGRGETAIPYLHRRDWVRLVRACIDRHPERATRETFLGCPSGALSHREILQAVRTARSGGGRPGWTLSVPPALAHLGLRLRTLAGKMSGSPPFERPWMLDYVDRPWVADTTRTQEKLGWGCSDENRLLARLSTLLDRLQSHRAEWTRRNRNREKGLYAYEPD